MIGIKYCGACHAAYNRKAALALIMDAVDDEFEPVKDGVVYDVVLVMNGCPSQCADTTRLKYKKGIISCFNLTDPAEIAERIVKLLNID